MIPTDKYNLKQVIIYESGVGMSSLTKKDLKYLKEIDLK